MKHILLVAICVCCLSCTNNKEKKESTNLLPDCEVVKVDLSKEYTNRKFPNTNQSMVIQRLEESEENPIGYINKLIVDKKKIYILDSSKAKSLFIYSRDGKLLHIIDRVGRGPGEYSFPQDFEVDKQTGNILVMDAGAKKIIFYSPKGEYLKEIQYDFFATKFTLDADNNLLLDTGNVPSEESEYCLKRIDQNGKRLGNCFPSNPSVVGISFNPRNPFQQHGKTLYYQPTMSNSVFALTDDGPQQVYRLDFGKAWPSEEFCESVQKMHPLKIRELMFKNNYVCFLNSIQTKDVLHVDFFKEKRYSFYYHKKTKQSLLLSIEEENISYPLSVYDNEFIFVKYREDTGEPVIVFYTVDFDLE